MPPAVFLVDTNFGRCSIRRESPLDRWWRSTKRAQIIRGIFALYLEGNSFAAIAKRLNSERVDPPRVFAAGRRIGWKDSTIRAIFYNDTYIGKWTYKSREWRKLPGTNTARTRHGTAKFLTLPPDGTNAQGKSGGISQRIRIRKI